MKISAYLSDHKEHLILIAVLIWIIGIIFSLFYLLSYLITSYGSIFLFLCFLVFLFHLGTRVATFPGAYSIWLRIIERSNMKSISMQACKRLEILMMILLLIKDSNFIEIYDRLAFSTLQSIPKYLDRIQRNLSNLKPTGLIPEQDLIESNIARLLKSLQDIKMPNENLTLYNFLSKPRLIRKPEFSNLNSVNDALEVSDILYNILKNFIKEPDSFKDLAKSLNFKAQVPLGSIDYMRFDVIDKFKAEQVWVTALDGTKIDCLWIPGNSKFSVIYCHPNGGFYEFINVQNEWIEFYRDLGYNVMVWNYRGYGRTVGHPAMPALANDGESVFKYVKEVRNSEKVIVHGQSLGGSVACRLGKVADFIFADRTFRGLTDVALISYGKVAFWIYKWFGPAETDPVKDFLAAGCYKVISCDPDDAMIPNISSLKAGVAIELTENPSKGFKIFGLIKKFRKIAGFNKLIQDLNSIKKFKLTKEDEIAKVDLIGSLCSLEVHGRNLYKISKKKEKEIELIIWLCSIHTWKELEKNIRAGIEEIERIVKEGQDCEESLILSSIIKNLTSILDENDLNFVEEVAGPGKVVTLHCGHNNSYQPYELYVYKSHLKAANVLPRLMS